MQRPSSEFSKPEQRIWRMILAQRTVKAWHYNSPCAFCSICKQWQFVGGAPTASLYRLGVVANGSLVGVLVGRSPVGLQVLAGGIPAAADIGGGFEPFQVDRVLCVFVVRDAVDRDAKNLSIQHVQNVSILRRI